MSAGVRIRAALELCRLSNAPTVVSNVLAGAALGAVGAGVSDLASSASRIALTAVACVAIYAAGMCLNDLMDRRTDALERPTRPIPSGRISARGAALLASVLVVGALFLLRLVGLHALLAGLVLVAMVVSYDALHARSSLTVILMGACRGLVYVVAAMAIGVPHDATLLTGCAVLLGLYVAGFSLVARREVEVARAEPAFVCGRCGYPSPTERGTCSECGATLDPARTGSVLAAALVGPRAQRLHVSLILPVLLLAAFALFPFDILRRVSGQHDLWLLAGTMLVAGFLAAWLAAATRLVERRPPAIGRAVGMWIAGISLFDAYLLVLAREPWLAVVALGCFGLTRILQRRIPAT